MIGQSLQFRFGHAAQIVEIHIIGAGARSIRCRAIVKGFATRFLTKGLDRFDDQRCFRQRVEKFGKFGGHRCQLGVDIGQIGFARIIVKLVAAAQMLEKVLQAAFKADIRHDLAHQPVNARNIIQADLMNFIRAEIGGRIILQALGIISRAIRKPPDAVTIDRDRLLTLHFGDQFLIGRLQTVDHRRCAARHQIRFLCFGNIKIRDLLLQIGINR